MHPNNPSFPDDLDEEDVDAEIDPDELEELLEEIELVGEFGDADDTVKRGALALIAAHMGLQEESMWLFAKSVGEFSFAIDAIKEK
jgi:hypothetical protein